MIKESLVLYLKEKKIPFLRDHPLKEYTSFRVGGPADIFIEPENEEQVLSLFANAEFLSLPYFYLGGGSNVLISDSGIRGSVVHLCFVEQMEILEKNSDFIKVYLPASHRTALAGKKIGELGYKNAEFLTTIPGTIGGAIVQNAGCYGLEIKDVLHSIRILDQGEICEIPAKDAEFSYRYSIFKEKSKILILGGTFLFPRGNPQEIQRLMEKYREHRMHSQPKNRRSAGSIFKNPKGQKAWQLLDAVGMRGVSCGGAEFSVEHANFIVNKGKAQARDIYGLICEAEKKVYEKFQIHLEKEVVLVGEFS